MRILLLLLLLCGRHHFLNTATSLQVATSSSLESGAARHTKSPTFQRTEFEYTFNDTTYELSIIGDGTYTPTAQYRIGKDLQHLTNENKAIALVIKYENNSDREPVDISDWENYGTCGYDIFSINGEEKHIEVKARYDAKYPIVLTRNELHHAYEDADIYWLYVVIFEYIDGQYTGFLFTIQNPYKEMR